MKTYTVVALYADNHQRYATSVEAADPDEAEREAQATCRLDSKKMDGPDPLIIAAVIEGKVKIVA